MANIWEKVKFSELCDITRGASPRPINNWTSNSGGVPWIKISDATRSDSRYITETKEFLIKGGEEKSVKVYPGDLILSNSATPGLPRFVKIYGCVHDGWLLLRNFRKIDKLFCFYLLQHEREKLVNLGNGSIFTNLKTEILKNHIVSLPPLPVQQKIASILGALDDKIELNRRMNRTLESIAQALFKHMFIDNPEREGWRTGILGDIASNVRKVVAPRDVDQGLPYIGLEHMPQRCIALENWGDAGGIGSNKFLFSRKSILFGKLRPYFHKVGLAPVEGVCSTDILVIIPKNHIHSCFLLCTLMGDDLINSATQASEGTKMPRTSWNFLSAFKINIPSNQAIISFNNLLDPVIDKLILNIYEIRQLIKTRKHLVQNIFK